MRNGDVGETPNRRNARTSSSGNYCTAESQCVPVNHQRARIAKRRVTEEHIHARQTEPGGRIVMRKLSAARTHALHDGGEIDIDAHAHSGITGGARLVHGARRAKERLRRHAAGVQAVAAQPLALDERHAGPKSGGANCRNETGGAAANRDEVINRRGAGITPTVGTYVREKVRVVFVLRKNESGAAHAFIFPRLD